MKHRIKEIRKSKGLTQSQLAETCETSLTMIQYVENGQRGLSDKWILIISDALGVPAWQLFADPDDIDIYPATERPLLAIYRTLNESEKDDLLKYARFKQESLEREKR